MATAYREIVERARNRDIRVIGCTLNPFEGTGYFSDPAEAVRIAVNDWIRKPGNFDATVDFDAVKRDPANPKQLLPRFNNGDHLHPNDLGYKAMADAIDLALFSKQ
jgi:lysophospholipase L1-like esterase